MSVKTAVIAFVSLIAGALPAADATVWGFGSGVPADGRPRETGRIVGGCPESSGEDAKIKADGLPILGASEKSVLAGLPDLPGRLGLRRASGEVFG